MKRLICLFIILICIPLISFADNPDPIVGTWYIYTGITDGLDVDAEAYIEFVIFHFAEDGTVFSSQYDLDSKGITTVTDYKAIALWSNDNGHYLINMGSQGTSELTIVNDSMFFPVSASYQVRIRRMDSVDPVLDFKTQSV